jgi:hypothetical protein
LSAADQLRLCDIGLLGTSIQEWKTEAGMRWIFPFAAGAFATFTRQKPAGALHILGCKYV